MNLLVLGKGKTGSIVAEIANERGHSVTSLDAKENENASALTPERLKAVDVVIDFTTPSAVLENITACGVAKRSMVIGTTGWYKHLDPVRQLTEASGIGLLYGSNFSVGVNVFFEIARAASAAIPLGYASRIMERHHVHKKDAPSGTAVTLQKILAESGGKEPEIASVREGETIGTHVMFFDSDNDSMMLVHDAKSRRGFAEGAVRAAEWLNDKKGFYEFKDIFRELK